MSHTWKLLPLAALLVFGLFVASGSVRLTPVQADIDDITVTGTLTEGDDNELDITVVGEDDQGELSIEITTDGDGDIEIDEDSVDVDGCSGEDPNSTDTEVTLATAACDGDTNAEELTVTFTVTIECEEGDEITISASDSSEDDDETLDCTEATTPSPSPTGTAGAARTVIVQSANQQLGCANTTIVTITVRGANGQPVAAGTLVNIQASLGAVSPTSGQTTADGSVFVFYTAPQNQGGTATITATAGSASGQATIAINCAQPTQAPPPTTAPTGGITPPSTGDGGLSGAGGWQTYAGVAMIIASVIGALVVVRPRA